MELSVMKQSDSSKAFTNLVFVSPADFATLSAQSPDPAAENQILVEFEGGPKAVGARRHVYAAAADPSVADGGLALSGQQRDDVYVALETKLLVRGHNVRGAPVHTMRLAVELRQQPAGNAPPLELDCTKLEKIFIKSFPGQVFYVGQKVLVKLRKTLVLTVLGIEFADLGGMGGGGGASDEGQFVATGTALVMEKAAGARVKLVGGSAEAAAGTSRNIFNSGFDFAEMGIGGLDAQFNTIFKRAFASRIFPEHVVEQLGIHHVRGMLLFGPPGCGKTLIARQIGKVLNAREPKIVNGPEILDKFVGGSEQKIRDLFADAEAEQKSEGGNSMLHIVIFDEFDAICKSRGSSSDSTGVSDSIVNQLLSKIDGVDSLNNILIIGMTNRKDMIDDAILRPGRLEVHVEIGLPDEAGRTQILTIHTSQMRGATPKRITDDAEARLPELAEMTKNFSGAELEGLVRAATSSAMDRCVNKDTMEVDASKLAVEWGDFMFAMTEVQPKFGAPTADLESYYSNGVVSYGSGFDELSRQLSMAAAQVQTSERTSLLTVLLEGDNMTGKTAVAAHLAVESGFPFVRMISADQLIGRSESAKSNAIQKVFMDSAKSPLSVIVLDDLERLIEYTPLGPRFSNTVLQTLLVLLKKPPPAGHSLLVVGTTAIAHLLEDVQLVSAFNLKLNLPRLQPAECRVALEKLLSLSPAALDAITTQIKEPIALKQLLLIVEMARQDDGQAEGGAAAEALRAEQFGERFAECLHTVIGF